MTFDAKLSVTEGLDHLAGRLDPIIAANFSTDLGGHPWTVVPNQLDPFAGKPPWRDLTRTTTATFKSSTLGGTRST
jgi:hypothetical protein